MLDAGLERVAREGPTEHMRYFAQLAAFHEEMHCEAFTYTRQTLGYPAPAPRSRRLRPAQEPPGRCRDPGRRFHARRALPEGAAFVFDNEKWAHPVRCRRFAWRAPQSRNAEFAAFVDDDGYRRRELWSEPGWRWRERAGGGAPGLLAQAGR